MATQSYIAAVLLLADPNATCPDNISHKIWYAMRKRIAAGQAFLATEAELVVSDPNHVALADFFAEGGTVEQAVEKKGADHKTAQQIYTAWKSVGHARSEAKSKVIGFAEATTSDRKTKKDAKPYQYKVLQPIIDGLQAFADDLMSHATAPDAISGGPTAYAAAMVEDLQHLAELSAPLQGIVGQKLQALELKGWEYSIRKDPTTGITRLTVGAVVDIAGHK